MDLLFLFKNLLGNFLLPPGNGLCLLCLAALFRRRRWAFAVALVGGGLLLAQSMPIVAYSLMGSLESRAGKPVEDPQGAQAIVVLGSGLVTAPPEYGGDFATDRTLIRVRHGAELARHFALPVLVTGGKPMDAAYSEAAVMAGLLTYEFGVPVRWLEERAADTADNARFSYQILDPEGIHRILLVTQAFHMPRARALFEAAGFEVIPAPTHFVAMGDGPISPFDFVPRAAAIQLSYYGMHEWLGIAWMNLAKLL